MTTTSKDYWRNSIESADSPEEFEAIRDRLRQERASPPATATADSQKHTLGHLKQQAAAYALGIRPRILRDHDTGARDPQTGLYDIRQAIEWHVQQRIEAARVTWTQQTTRNAHERLELANAKKRELEYEIMQGRYVDRQEITNEFAEMAAAVRSELEAVGPRMENDLPADVRAEVIGELKAQHRHILRRLANRGREYDA